MADNKMSKKSLFIGSIIGSIIQILSLFIPPVGQFWQSVTNPDTKVIVSGDINF